MKNTDELEFFKNYLELYPASENWIYRKVSFYNESKGIPRNSMNSSIQSSVYKISKYMYLIITAWIIEGIPGIEIAIIEFIGKNEISYIWIHKIWIANPIIKFAGVFFVKANLPPWIRSKVFYSNFCVT